MPPSGDTYALEMVRLPVQAFVRTLVKMPRRYRRARRISCWSTGNLGFANMSLISETFVRTLSRVVHLQVVQRKNMPSLSVLENPG